MSGGSLNYLCFADAQNLLSRVDDLEIVERELLDLGARDVARDARRLIEYIISAENRISVLAEQLEDIFHDVEWYHSADIGVDTLKNTIEKYRRGKHEKQAD